ncbi:peptide chain release factor N(5)-glutamine methyltransferase [Leptothoe kymatousa TAU-MAC 1615]|uniref:Release factor glutamine methyltransferase n=2 Tax=Leptothoe TaxID=2651725 RepID=A0ABS5Y049_9CYAN|nr:peptide chain release factor N(5)-glutamine methyltransferase [Leptothoe kymatousa TAU-MAC 1615]
MSSVGTGPYPEGATVVAGEALYQWKLQAQGDAQKADIPVYELDWFLQGISPLSQSDLSLGLYRDRTVPLRHPLDWLTQQWQRRVAERVPVQYLVGETPWRDLMLTVTPDVLIPRPETELIVEIVQAWVQQQPKFLASGVWADLGTGSGAIAIALAKALPHAQVLAVDISAAALAIAKENAQRNQVTNIEFHQSSWFDALENWRGQLCGVITNPPYIPSDVVLTLEPEVTHHEPHTALDGGHDGLDDIRLLIEQSPDFLHPGGMWLTEHMQGQAHIIANLLSTAHGYDNIQVHADLAGIERFVSATLTCSQ